MLCNKSIDCIRHHSAMLSTMWSVE